MGNKFIDGFFFQTISEKGTELGIADLNASDIQHRF